MTSPPVSAVRQRRILLIASAVSSLVMLDSNVVAVALPTIARSLSASFADLQWVITAYVLPFAALLLAAGSFADIVGRKRAVLLGQVIFAVASLGCGAAQSALVLNLSRAVQGIGASLLLTAALAIINHSFQGADRARAYAFWGASLGIAITCGPILGGVISSAFGWHWAFLVNLPVCAVLVAATIKEIPESADPAAKRLDVAGIATFSAGLFLMIWAVIDGNALGWLSATVVRRLAGGVALLVAFVAVERMQSRPMVDFAALRSRAFAGSAFAMVGYAGGAQVMIFYLPLYLQNAYGLAPAAAGLAMLPFAVPMFVVPRLSARFAAAWPSRRVLCAGLGISTAANAVLAMLATSGAGYAAFAAGMAAAGIGAGLLNGETAKAMQGSLPANRSGMASGLSGTVRFAALLFGVAGLGAMLITATAARFASAASVWGLPADAARTAAKRFAAGDEAGALLAVPGALHAAVADALRLAFDGGFGAAAWSAAGVALAMLVLTRALMPGRRADAARAAGDVELVAPGE